MIQQINIVEFVQGFMIAPLEIQFAIVLSFFGLIICIMIWKFI